MKASSSANHLHISPLVRDALPTLPQGWQERSEVALCPQWI